MSACLPEGAYALALAMAPAVGPATLRGLLRENPPSVAWAQASGESGQAIEEVAAMWDYHEHLGISVLLRNDPAYPDRLLDDPEAPAVLFCLGDPTVLARRATVALVGTRAPTRYGIGVAAQLGAELSAAGVSIVSGLALGVDAAAHEGACGAGEPPIGVVAGGLDEPYPRRHARLWERVAGEGVIVSESPAGARTEKWRFPVRNKLLASLSDVVVVVESRHHGGSRHTVEAALVRGIPIGAVPGSIRSATSEGTNALLAEGAFPVCSAADVLVALSLAGASLTTPLPAEPELGDVRSGGASDRIPPEAGEERLVFDALTSDPSPLDDLLRATGLSLPALCGALERLGQAGLARDAGGWWERA
ncbi:MAG TPA: DNA-protecting protein DprA [Acidimicrobiales bacterium]|nr:DNA-protecting protein DprA [Acidimicrobiales bacterium]